MIELLKQLIEAERRLFEQRKDFFIELISKKDSCAKRLVWLANWINRFMELEKKVTDIERSIEKQIEFINENEKEELLKVLTERYNYLISYYKQEIEYWYKIADNIKLSINKDIDEYSYELRNLSKETVNIHTA